MSTRADQLKRFPSCWPSAPTLQMEHWDAGFARMSGGCFHNRLPDPTRAYCTMGVPKVEHGSNQQYGSLHPGKPLIEGL